jgi:hypothetical protein
MISTSVPANRNSNSRIMNRIMSGIDGLRRLAILKTTPNVEKRMFLFRYLILVSNIEAHI